MRDGDTAGDEEAATDYGRTLLKETREELNRADTKASVAFGAVGVGAGAVLGGLIGGDWRPTELGPCASVVWWVGAVGAAIAVVLLAAAVYPRVEHSKGRERLTFFGHAAEYESPAALASALAAVAACEQERSADQLWHVARIARDKYRCIRWGLRVLGGSAVLIVGALLLAMST